MAKMIDEIKLHIKHLLEKESLLQFEAKAGHM